MKQIIFGVIFIAVTVFAELSVAAPASNSSVITDCADYNTTKACCAEEHCTFMSCDGTEPGQCYNSTNVTETCPDGQNLCQAATTLAPSNGTEATGTTQGPTTVTPTSVVPTDNGTDTTTAVPEEGTTGTPEDAGTTTPQQDLTSSTTPNPVPVSTTTVNNTDTTTTGSQCAEQTGQRFDGASFIGGIVLCGGLVAIVFFSVQFYRSRSENRYHQF